MDDLETIMADLGNIFKNNINAKITELNTEKGDDLLAPFDENAFSLYAVENINYPIKFGLVVIDTPNVNSHNQGTEITYELGLMVLLARTADNLSVQAQRIERYNRLFIDFINSYFVNNYSSIEVVNVSSPIFENKTKEQLYDSVVVHFTIQIIY